VKNSILMSVTLVIGVCIWMFSGTLSNANYAPVKIQAPVTKPLMKVRVANYSSQLIEREIIIQGQLEPKRKVQLRAETEGLVKSLPVEKGSSIAKGELLFSLQEGNRQAQLKRADSDVKAKKLELKAMRKLKASGLQAENQLKTAQANLDAAVAEFKRIQLDIKRTQIRAPFSGVLESRQVEIGTLIQEGDVLGEVIDNSILKAVGYVPQQSAQAIQLNQSVEIKLIDGRKLNGEISYMAHIAEPETRSFRIEANIPNLNQELRAGVSAEIRISVGQERAHFISPALLTLDEAGRVGVKVVVEQNKVQFYPVKLARNEPKGVWISGLPDMVKIIRLGQNFVRVGDRVETQTEARL